MSHNPCDGCPSQERAGLTPGAADSRPRPAGLGALVTAALLAAGSACRERMPGAADAHRRALTSLLPAIRAAAAGLVSHYVSGTPVYGRRLPDTG